ncbi:hypothetical protein [Actinoplanes sp. L3-i22]|uniref:hypothetical protein n=1 Tax=Actinoplanes sp. L3-i22 TaxID=2836373 RepID=UPI001C7678FC|nr:hypothetical protein [Actinoplanes sp. L3-i22]BCY12997.1 hypothetical protein L3i22_080850 [Actinoplanes sp. L3-i22]
MRKRLAAAMIAILPAAGMVAACAHTESSGSNTGATPNPAGTAEIRSSASAEVDNVLFSAPAPVAATVRCTSGSWLYVTTTGVPYPSTSGYVRSGAVAQAGSAPACDPAILARYPQLPGSLTLRPGAARENEFWYAVQLRDFPPGTSYTVACYEDDNAFGTFTARTDTGGNAFRDDGCRSLGGTRHWVRIGPYRSAVVEWPAATPGTSKAGRPPSRKPQSRATTPALPPFRPPTTGKPIIPTGPVTPPPPISDDDPADEQQHGQDRQQQPATVEHGRGAGADHTGGR